MYKNARSFIYLFPILIMALLLFHCDLKPIYAQQVKTDLYGQLKYRFIGPQGNRVIAVIGEPGNPNICYAGAASGGIFKSIDGGIHWEPIFDSEKVSSIGSLAIAPADYNIIWAGTGETSIRSNISQGIGIYKSVDAGKTWRHMGLEKTGRIGRIIIDPRNPNIVFAAAMGHCYGPQQERGVFRTTDGGETWERVLFIDENTGCSDLVMDPNNPRILFAGMWTMFIRTWGRWSGGPGDGLYVSRDGGSAWKRLTGHGLPDSTMGKIALAMSSDNSNRIYALIETKEGVLWRSDDGGENWKLINRDHTLTQRPHYYSRCAVSPDDYNEIYFVATRYSVSLDGGETFDVLSGMQSPGGDNHDVWIDPLNPDRIIIGNDNPSVSISYNRGKSWDHIRMPTAQMYHVYVDSQIPYYVYGNRQDGPSTRGPSNSLTGNLIPSGMWHSVGGCESGFAIPDPLDNNIVWSGCYSGHLDRFDLRTGHSRSVDVYPDGPLGSAAADAKYRFQWTFPIAISPHDHNKVYVGSQHVHQTTDGGNSWTIISPDLTTNDKSKQRREGGITSDDATPTYCCCLFAIAESPLQKDLIWAGTNDGLLHVTRDGGENWINVSNNIPNLIPWGTVSNIEPSRYDEGTCYFTMDYHQVNNRDPYVYKTTDYGNSWELISKDVPKSELSYAHCVREDPVRKGLLYLGTENALYISFDDGANWHSLQSNLPHAPVHWLVIQEHFNDIVVGTYGRGFWIMDDVTPLQQLTSDVLNSEAYFFTPRPVYRFRNVARPMVDEDDQCAGQNPTYGASINYYLKSIPENNVKINIVDDNGQNIRTLKGTKELGVNRVWWDLRYEQTKQAELRTSPIDHPWVVSGPKGWRALGRSRMRGPLVAPGTYTLKLFIGEQEWSQILTVKKDPNSVGTDEDIQVQTKMMLEIRDNVNLLVDMINQIEWIRWQFNSLKTMFKNDESNRAVIAAGNSLEKNLIDVEENLFQMRLTGGTATQDSLRWPNKYYAKILRFASKLSSSDYAPTVPQLESHERFKKLLLDYKNQLNSVINTDLTEFNNLLKEKKIPNVILVNEE